ncbi:hypothetical protein Cni_G21584 [Canna indica]|uniref:Uncharacterized protein n=1 Tax=Canna indica TaxID=4628 RepID=A0AAQ3QHF3_9LILI|nr:hypothetical protein Cni_G21584 [Canna indica]
MIEFLTSTKSLNYTLIVYILESGYSHHTAKANKNIKPQQIDRRPQLTAIMAMHAAKVVLLDTCTILKEALLLPNKNLSLILSVFFISFLASAALSLSGYLLSIYPFLAQLTNISPSPSSSAYPDLLKELIAVELVLNVVALIISFILRTIIIYALAMTYTCNLLTLRELLCEVKGMMKGPFITQLCVTLLRLGCVVLLTAFVSTCARDDAAHGATLWIAVVVAASLVAAAAYLYLVTLCSLSVAVSVVEQGRYGVGAFRRATELMEGRKWNGVAIVVASVVVTHVITVVYNLVFGKIPVGVWSQIGVGLFYNLVVEAENLFFMAAITVYYYYCRRVRGEDKETCDGINNFGYASIPASDVV